MDPHTLKFLRKEEQFIPGTMPYRSFDRWREDPKSLVDEAQDKVDQLLGQHEVPPLEESLQKELNRIEQSAINALTGP